MTNKKACAKVLNAYAKRRNEETIQTVNRVLDELTAKNEPVNFEIVARLAGVSRGTLYNNEVICARIKRLRAGGTDAHCAALREKNRRQEEKLRALRKQIQRLEEEKELLIIQLLDYEELKMENKRLRVRLDAALACEELKS